MADERESGPESGPTYKALFLCSVALVGSLIGYWAMDLKHTVARLWEQFEKHNGRLTTLEAGSIENRIRQEHLQQEIDRAKAAVDTNSKSIRDLERDEPRR